MADEHRLQEVDDALGALLAERGKLDKAGLERVRRLRGETGRRLDAILTGLGLVGERDIAAALSDFLDIPLARPEDYPLAPVPDGELSVDFLQQRRIVPLEDRPEALVVAMADPLDDFSIKAIALKANKPVETRIAVPSDIEKAFERLYGTGKSAIEEIVESLDSDLDDTAADAEQLKDLASEAPVIRLVSLLITDSVERRASDIHIEPFENRLRVRYRIDGVMHEVASHPSRLRFAVISRIKIMAKLNIAERRLPQDGRIKLSVRGKEVDLRVSTVPIHHGESVVLRILDKSAVALDFIELGFDSGTLATFSDLLARPNGIVLVTGPTGSGKTTTLYTALADMNSPARKILTVEDPIEFQLDGINQIAVKPQIGLGFADILRSILRQDPDIIMVGEIRDLETAQIAVQAALTGHLVLSTLHTNSAAATVTRLLEMGVEGYFLNSTLLGVLAQRLVRRLCEHCRKAYDVDPELARQLRLERVRPDSPAMLYRAEGCEKCEGTGYRGRLCIAEALVVDSAIQSLIVRNAEEREIHQAAIDGGMQTLYESGLRKALEGLTSIEEVLRVTRDV